ncbi:hypothetical protein [Streptomyces spiramyceticus]|uniref:hypothetical protein n=1 Tax=Streptomyces spiramyceticus TaxID=299717 RepID=UPI00237B8D85|nr:hypothetical protein [Streptomyces spiramyceticus]
MKYVSYLLGGAAAVGAGAYLFVYLYRWEWQRAVVCGLLLLIVEIFLVTTVLLSRLSRLERRLDETEKRAEEVQRRLEQAREGAPERFRWLDTRHLGDRSNANDTFVFVPVLMATGVALSAAALLIQKIAGATGRAGAERRLAGRLARLAAPPGGVQADIRGIDERPAVPPSRPVRTLMRTALALAVAVMVTLLTFVLADAVQTRRAPLPDSAASMVVFRVEVRSADTGVARDLAARDFWETCRRSTAAEPEHAQLTKLEHGVYAGVVRPALPDHDLLRLRGCLMDASANRAQAEVLGEGQAPPVP